MTRKSLALACMGLAITPGAARADAIEDAVRACAAQADSLRRLLCYDQVAAGIGAAAAPPSVAASTPPPAPAPSAAPAASPVANFGVHNGPLDPQRGAVVAKQITAAITGIEMRPRGELVVMLDNGQKWMESQPVEYFPLKLGETVQIRAAALGSYMLFAPNKRSARVIRIQ